jgi:hypothetical protein
VIGQTVDLAWTLPPTVVIDGVNLQGVVGAGTPQVVGTECDIRGETPGTTANSGWIKIPTICDGRTVIWVRERPRLRDGTVHSRSGCADATYKRHALSIRTCLVRAPGHKVWHRRYDGCTVNDPAGLRRTSCVRQDRQQQISSRGTT